MTESEFKSPSRNHRILSSPQNKSFSSAYGVISSHDEVTRLRKQVINLQPYLNQPVVPKERSRLHKGKGTVGAKNLTT